MNPEAELATLEDLIDQIIRGVQEALQNGEVLSDEFQGQIAQELNATYDRIVQLQDQIQGAATPPAAALGAPPSPDAQLLWILAGQQEQAFLSYIREFPTPEMQALANNPTELSRTINFLNRMMPQGAQPTIGGIQHADLNSSNIWGSRYDKARGKMRVRFQGGAEYEYDGVPENIYRAFEKGNATAKTTGSNEYGAWFRGKNPSLGAALNQYIKAGNFPYRRLR